MVAAMSLPRSVDMFPALVDLRDAVFMFINCWLSPSSPLAFSWFDNYGLSGTLPSSLSSLASLTSM